MDIRALPLLRGGPAAALLALGLLAAPFQPAAAAPPQWTVDKAASRVGFTAYQMGDPVDGAFGDYEATIRFSPDDLAGSSARVVIDIASVDTGSDQRDTAIRSGDFMAVDTHPHGLFEATAFEKQADGDYTASGRLTLKDVTKDAALPFELKIEKTANGQRAEAQGAITINRFDYGIGRRDSEYAQVVGEQVEIRIEIVATRPGS